jgi:glutaminase
MINQEYIENTYNKIKNDKIEGKNADYIPELSKVDEKLYALSIHTVNGETYNFGDYNHKNLSGIINYLAVIKYPPSISSRGCLMTGKCLCWVTHRRE